MSKEVYTVRYSYLVGDIGPADKLLQAEKDAVNVFSKALYDLQNLGIRVELIYKD